MLATLDPGQIAGLVIGSMITGLMGLLVYIFRDQKKDLEEDITVLRAEVQGARKELSDDIKDNTRHLQSLMQSEWTSIYRISHVEDYLTDKKEGFKPLRIIPNPEDKR